MEGASLVRSTELGRPASKKFANFHIRVHIS